MGGAPPRATLIFDGTCDFCTWSVRLVQALDRGHRVTVAPFQQPGVMEEHGLSIAQCEAAAWALAPAPRPMRYRGAGAINLALSVALGTPLPLRIYELPGMRQIQDAAYSWVARNRHRFPGVTPHCVQFPDDCP